MMDVMQAISPEMLRTLVRGAAEIEDVGGMLVLHRLPEAARRRNVDPQLAMTEGQPSGIRLAFSTKASVIELDTLPTKRVYVGMPARPDGVYDLVVDGELAAQQRVSVGRVLRIDMRTGGFSTEDGPVQTLRFAGLADGEKRVEIWLPHDEATALMALRADAPVRPLVEDAPSRWLHHGSSISHGSNAASPTGIWPVVAARQAGVSLANMGFGGGAMLDSFTARAIRDTPADRISFKMGINIVNGDLMRMRAFGPALHGFIDTIRDGHPTTPLLVISPIHCPIHEETPGPAAPDMEAGKRGEVRFVATGNPDEVRMGKLTLRSVRAAMAAIVAERAKDDVNLYYLDGTALYGPDDGEPLPLPDGLHPDAATHALMGERFEALARSMGFFR